MPDEEHLRLWSSVIKTNIFKLYKFESFNFPPAFYFRTRVIASDRRTRKAAGAREAEFLGCRDRCPLPGRGPHDALGEKQHFL